MASADSITSTNYLYLPVRVDIRGQREEELALIDTGYDGNLVIPTTWRSRLGLPDGRTSIELGDGSIVPGAPFYLGTLEIVGFYSTPLRITVLGNEYILGRGVLDRFEITLDHGQRLIVRP